MISLVLELGSDRQCGNIDFKGQNMVDVQPARLRSFASGVLDSRSWSMRPMNIL